MIIQKNIFILILSLIFGSCLVLPKTETASVKNCELETKSWTLEVHEIGLNNECHGCGDFVKGIIYDGKYFHSETLALHLNSETNKIIKRSSKK